MALKDLSQQAKEQLSQIKKTDRLIDRLLAAVQTLRSGLASQSYELQPDRVQTSGPKDRLAEIFARIDDLERKINARIDDLIRLKEDTLKVIYQIPDKDQQNVLIARYVQDTLQVIYQIPDKDQQNVLIARYVQGERWEKIAVDLNFSIAQVYRLHGKALVNFGKMIVFDS